MTEQKNPLPFGFPDDPIEFAKVLSRRTAWLRRMFGPGTRATSAVQHVLARAIERGPTSGSSRGFWQAVINRLRDLSRRDEVAKRYKDEVSRRASTAPPSTGPGPEARLVAEETRAALGRLIAELSPADQDLLRRLEAGEAYDAIAAASGRTVVAVKQAVSRVRARVLEALPPDLRRQVLGRDAD